MMEWDNTALPFRSVQRFSTFERFVSTHLIFIEFGKIVNNDRNGKRDNQYSTNAAYSSNDFPCETAKMKQDQRDICGPELGGSRRKRRFDIAWSSPRGVVGHISPYYRVPDQSRSPAKRAQTKNIRSTEYFELKDF